MSFSTSGEANGMGGIMSSTPSSSPSAIIFNPAQLGFLSRTYFLSAEFYTMNPHWNNGFGRSDQLLSSYTIMSGHRFTQLSIGFSYSRISLDMGEITLIDRSNSNEPKIFQIYDVADNFSIGLGFQYGILQWGIGLTIKQITSHLPGISTSGQLTGFVARPIGADLGLLFNIPIADLFIDKENPSAKPIVPFTDLSIGYAINNFGENVYYADAAQSDPLPRTARLGWSAEVGYRYRSEHATITLGSIMIAREAEEYLFARHPNGHVYYKNLPTGNMNISRSLLEGKYYDYVTIRKGFALSFLETITIRSGSFHYSGINAYGTNGITVSTNGIFKFLSFFSQDNQSSIMDFIFNRFEIRYNQSHYSGSNSTIWGSNYKNITLSVRH